MRALVGGADYRASQYNRITQARRPPASAFKPVVYLAGLEAGFTPDSKLRDQPIKIGDWRPRNHNGRFNGSVAMADALAKLMNPAAVWLQEQVGRDKVVEMAERLGLGTKMKEHPSLALGTADVRLLDLASGYAGIANDGLMVRPHAILEVRTVGGVVVYAPTPPRPRRIASARHASQMTAMLRHAVHTGTGKVARLPGVQVAGKSGTSSKNRDAWFLGSAQGLTAGVWVGNDDNSAMRRGVYCSGLPARLWARVMHEAVSGPALATIVPTPRPRPIDGISAALDRVLSLVLSNDASPKAPAALPQPVREAGRELGGGLLRWLADKVEAGGNSTADGSTDDPTKSLKTWGTKLS